MKHRYRLSNRLNEVVQPDLDGLSSQVFLYDIDALKIAGKEKPASARRIIFTCGHTRLNRQNNHRKIPATSLPAWRFPGRSCL